MQPLQASGGSGPGVQRWQAIGTSCDLLQGMPQASQQADTLRRSSQFLAFEGLNLALLRQKTDEHYPPLQGTMFKTINMYAN